MAKRAFKKNLKKTLKKKTFKKSGVKKIVKTLQEQGGLTVINKPSKTMNFSRSNIGALTITNTLATSTQQGIQVHRLQDIPLYTEFSALFDKYKFNKIKYTWRMVNSPDATEDFPVLFTYKMNDPDSIATTPSETLCEQQPRCYRMQFSNQNTMFSQTIYPYWLGLTYAAGAATLGYDYNSAKKSSYLDTHYPNIAHYGLCWFIPTIAGALTTTWKIVLDIEYSLSFKSMT